MEDKGPDHGKMVKTKSFEVLSWSPVAIAITAASNCVA
jgi:hypothetical protein